MKAAKTGGQWTKQRILSTKYRKWRGQVESGGFAIFATRFRNLSAGKIEFLKHKQRSCKSALTGAEWNNPPLYYPRPSQFNLVARSSL
ncbi:MAG: hypothetical protein DU429_03770 [Candidatus Tokpelaia sp.]|nr:MAG: hypothetical protein DU430_07665 [Candidatus Tokpelaia sp.]KAA6207214.1 MAG: hypothetical protein DU429_03770 [Candidatus Tokpelaia sp.]